MLTSLNDLADRQARIPLAVAGLPAVARLGLVLEDDNLLAATVLHDLGQHLRAFDQRPAHGHLRAFADHEHIAQLDLIAWSYLEQLDVEGLTLADGVLLTAAANYRVHTAVASQTGHAL